MSKTGTRRSHFKIKRGSKLGLFKIWMRRTGVIVIACIALIGLGSFLWFSGTMQRAGGWVQQKSIQVTSNMGFNVQNILVEGRTFTDPQVILAIVNTQKGDPIFGFDPNTARAQIEKISWVKSVRVERRLPDTIYIGLQERKPLALWQRDQKLWLIDDEGVALTDSNLAPFEKFVMVVGENAPQHAAELLGLLAAEPTVTKDVESAIWIGDRRWDLILSTDIVVRLPEDDIGLALKRLANAQADDGLLNKDITEVDLRETDRLVVRTRPGNVQEYKATLTSAEGNDI